MQTVPITAVIVLYERAPHASEAFASLRCLLDEQPALYGKLAVVLYDHSATAATEIPASSALRLHYVHDGRNLGLATAYTYALAHAQSLESTWLLLLDQDTTLTMSYLTGLLGEIERYSSVEKIAAIVPLLELDGRIYSPEADFFFHLRHQFPHTRFYPVLHETAGPQTQPLNAYNSGAAIRVSALHSIGGFPAEFPIDFLDHAVFHLLQTQGFSIDILPAILQQKLSHIDLDSVSLKRHTSVLRSQMLFVYRYGTLLDRLLFRLWILRRSRQYRILCTDRRVWRAMVNAALGVWQIRHREGNS